MPGGGGGGSPRPPNMRLRPERRVGVVVYTDGSPKSPFWLWVRALAQFAAAAFFLGLPFLIVGSVVLSAVGRKTESVVWLAPLAWTLGTAIAVRVILLGPARREVEPSGRRRALVFRRIYLWGQPRERELHKPEVEAIVLLGRDRGGPYLQLRLVLADGRTIFVEEGKEKARMEELARDVGSALALPVTPIPAPSLHLPFGGHLTRLRLASAENRWVDFDCVSRLLGTWAVCLGSLLLSGGALLGTYYAAGSGRPPDASDSRIAGVLFLAGTALVAALMFTVSAACLRLPRYRGLRLPPKGGCVVLQRLGLFGRRRDEALLTDGATAVVLVRNRKGEPQQVWLERLGAKRLYIDGGGKGEELARLAEDLARQLRIPVRRADRSVFLV